MERTRGYLDEGRFPLIVAEGTSEAKLARILRSPYLKAARKSFDWALRTPSSSLFTLGHGLSDRDAHFLKRIGDLKIGSVFVGAYGGLDSADGAAAKRWAARWAEQRRESGGLLALQVYVFDTKNVSAWRKARPVIPQAA